MNGVSCVSAGQRAAHRGFPGNAAFEHIRPHGGHQLIGHLLIAHAGDSDSYPVIKTNFILAGAVGDNFGGGDHALKIADAALAFVQLLLGRLVFKIFAQIAEGPGLLHRFDEFGQNGGFALFQFSAHLFDVLCGQFVVHESKTPFRKDTSIIPTSVPGCKP